MLQWKAGFEERCKSQVQKTEEVRCTLYGEQGTAGMVKQVDRLVQSDSRWKDFGFGVLKVLVATFIISLAGWLLLEYSNSKTTQTEQVEKEYAEIEREDLLEEPLPETWMIG